MAIATRATSFINSIGVEIHDEYTQSWSPYASAATVDAALAYLNPDGIGTGVSTLRDESGAPTAELAALGKLGYKLDIYTSYGDAGNNTAASAINPLTTLVNDGYVRLIEGPLEVDNAGWGLVNAASYTALNGNTYTGWKAAVEWQKDLYSTFAGKTEVALFSLANPSDGAANSAAVQAASQLGLSLGGITNVGNVHFYEHNGNAPATEMSGVIAQETGYTPGEGFAITETGFNDDTSGSAASIGYRGTPYANGVYTLDLVLDAFKAGSSLTDIYELFDENNPNYASEGITFENHWGLFNSNGTPKLAATYLHNMMAVLGDTGSNAATFTPGSLNYTVSGLGSNGKSLLLEKSNGAFDIAVWADANIDTNGVQTTAPTQNVTVNLGGTFGTVEVFDPVKGSAAVQKLTNVSSVTLGVTDHPLIIEVEPATGTPPQPPAVSPNDTVVLAGSTAAITDASGSKWTITSGGQVAVNGTVDAVTAKVIEMAYVNGTIWQENSNKLWWGETQPNDSWAPAAGTATSPLPATPPPPPAVSPNDTVVLAGSTAAITDASGNKWTITSGGQVAVNSTVDAVTAKVIEMAYVNGTIWQENSNKLWWGETQPNDAWAPAAGTATSPLPATPPQPPAVNPPPNDTVVLAGSTAAITDASGNKWTITAGGQVAVNGTVDAVTAKVIEMAYVNGTIWQENSNNLWWGETQPNDSWAPAAGTATSPLPPTPSPTDTVVLAGSTAAITDASGNKWTLTAGGQVAVNGVADTTTSSVTELDYTKGSVWQENINHLWWSKTSPSAAWGPAAGTATPPISITVTDQATAAVTTIDATKAQSATDYGATFSLTAPGVAKVTLGITSDKLAFTAMSSITLTAGSAASTVMADGGTNTFTAGTGALSVTGGTGADSYFYHSGDALLSVGDFSAAKGDTLTIDTALKGSLVTASDGHGGTMLTFGSLGAGVDLQSVAAVPAIHWA